MFELNVKTIKTNMVTCKLIIFAFITCIVSSTVNVSALSSSTVSGSVVFNGNANTKSTGNRIICLLKQPSGGDDDCKYGGGVNGAYAFNNVADGNYGYAITESAGGHVSGLNSGAYGYPDKYNISTYEPVVSVSSNDVLHNLNFKTNKITVTAVDVYGKPVPNAGFDYIQLAEGVPPSAPVTDSDGHTYSLSNVEDYDQINSSGFATSSVFPGYTYSICLHLNNDERDYCTSDIEVTGDTAVQIVTTPIARDVYSKSPTQYPELTWNEGADDGSFDIYRDGVVVGTSTTRSFTDKTAPEGNHTYQVLARASNGTASSRLSKGKDVTVDRTPPKITSVNWSSNPSPAGSDTTLSITTDEAIQDGEYYINSDPGVGNGTMINSDGTATFGSNLNVGAYTIGIRARDLAGNWSSTSMSRLVVYYSIVHLPTIPGI